MGIFRVLLLGCLALIALPAQALDQAQTDELIKTLDERQRNVGDFRALIYIERKERNKSDVIQELVVYRRDETDRMVMLFQKPKAEAGKGYLSIDKNFFWYDPTVGKWERRTERERIGGTDSRRRDYDESRLAQEYDAKWIADEKLGKFDVHHIELKVKKGVDVAYPVMHLWIDVTTGNTLKQQEMALSGKLMRTSYFPKWNKVYSALKKAEVHVPVEQRIFDEVEKGNSTTMLIQKVDFEAQDDSIFTKAWLEARSR